MASTSETSITRTAALEFARTANVHSELSCENIKGFYLRKTASKATWYLRYTDFTGKRRKLNLGPFIDGTKDRIDAAKAAINYRQILNQGIDPKQAVVNAKAAFVKAENSKESRLLGNYLSGPYSRHQARKKDHGKHTINIISSAFNLLLEREMDKLTFDDLSEWATQYAIKTTDKLGKPISYKSISTLERAFGALKTLLLRAIKDAVISDAQILKLSLRELLPPDISNTNTNNHSKRRLLTATELEKIQLGLKQFAREAIDKRTNSLAHGKSYLPDLAQLTYPHWFIPFTLIAMHTGMRPGDIYELRWHNIDFTNNIIHFKPQKTKHHIEPANVKFPMTKGLQQTLFKWRKQSHYELTGSYVFTNPKTKNRYNHSAHKKPWSKLKSLARLDSELDFYSFRHHFISHLVRSGVPLFTIAKLVGHKSTKTIEKYYGHLCQKEALSAVELIDDSISYFK